MSEEKIIQHSEHALHILQDKKSGWGKKLREFFVEILIIVFAVSITLLLHNWNDGRHERRLEREFLEGIKLDLDSGVVDLQENTAWFQHSVDYFDSVRQQIATGRFNAAYLDSNSWHMMNSMYFTWDIGRFEAFKSSGYLRLIENQKLLKRLMTLYTVRIPFQVEEDRNIFIGRGRYYDEHIGPRATYVFTKSGDNQVLVSRLVDDPGFRYFIIKYTGSLQEKQKQKTELAAEMKEIAAEIAAELASR